VHMGCAAAASKDQIDEAGILVSYVDLFRRNEKRLNLSKSYLWATLVVACKAPMNLRSSICCAARLECLSTTSTRASVPLLQSVPFAYQRSAN
jgi:hypothetical protein